VLVGKKTLEVLTKKYLKNMETLKEKNYLIFLEKILSKTWINEELEVEENGLTTVLSLKNVNDNIGLLDASMDQLYLPENKCFQFSNSGQRGGKKYFLVTTKALKKCFEDILDNKEKFISQKEYVENIYRNLFSKYIRDPLFYALSTVSDEAIVCSICKVNSSNKNETPDTFNENHIDFSEDNIKAVIELLSEDEVELPKSKPHYTTSKAKTGGYNKIFYGAPGTGKSHAIKLLTKHSEDTVIRTVFHADTQNSDFIGCLKPSTKGSDIIYSFQPGPFTNALVNAFQVPDKMHYLVIEEINRASAAAVFGEVFQLLDRGHEGPHCK
jgi:hypothetical protein